MTRAEYLFARGWRRDSAQPPEDRRWYDPLNPHTGHISGKTEQQAEAIQLDRDVALREYVAARRPQVMP